MHAVKTLVLLTLAFFMTAGHAFGATDAVQRFPDVIKVQVSASGDNRFSFSATLLSPYDTPERYTDAFRIMTVNEATLGIRELLHDHASEQCSGLMEPDSFMRDNIVNHRGVIYDAKTELQAVSERV